MQKKILFIGSFLSKKRGTKSVAENIKDRLSKSYRIKLSSSFENKFLRLADILVNVLFYNYDIIHIDIFSGKALWYANIASFVAKFRKKKIIMTLHGGRLPEVYLYSPEKLDFLLNRADVITSPSKYLTEFFSKQNYYIRYLPNFIDIKKFPYDRSAVKPFSLLWVRAFNNIYKPEMAVKVVNILKNKFPNIKMTMIGPDKGYLNKIENIIKNLGLEDRINLIGKVQNDKLYEYYQTHAVYLNTTQYESFGLAVLEAASCGIPIVSTKVGEIPYIWDNNIEILLCSSVEDDMAKNVQKIFNSCSLAAKLSTNARLKAEKFDWQMIEEQWYEVFDELA